MKNADAIKILENEIKNTISENSENIDAVNSGVNALKMAEKLKEIIIRYRCSAVAMKNQKTYFTDHDVGYCEGTLDVFEQAQNDLEAILKEYKLF